VSKWNNGRGQNDTMDSVKVARSIGTYPHRDKHQRPTPGKFPSSKRTTTKPTTGLEENRQGSTSYRDDFKGANEWLESQAKDFQEQVRNYLEYNCNTPKVKYPHALRMKIIVEIWKKYNDKTNQTDFEYINMKSLKPSKREEIRFNNRKRFDSGYEAEMESLYLKGEVE
jgi:hypothetical protein